MFQTGRPTTREAWGDLVGRIAPPPVGSRPLESAEELLGIEGHRFQPVVFSLRTKSGLDPLPNLPHVEQCIHEDGSDMRSAMARLPTAGFGSM